MVGYTAFWHVSIRLDDAALGKVLNQCFFLHTGDYTAEVLFDRLVSYLNCFALDAVNLVCVIFTYFWLTCRFWVAFDRFCCIVQSVAVSALLAVCTRRNRTLIALLLGS